MMTSGGKVLPSMIKNAADLYSNQGMAGFYRGIDSNIARTVVLTATKMAVYDHCKEYVIQITGLTENSLVASLLSATTAGFFVTCTVAPLDMINTRLMNQPPHVKMYNNAVDCMVNIVIKEGPFALWRGFMPLWFRFAPATILQLTIVEHIRAIMGMKNEAI